MVEAGSGIGGQMRSLVVVLATDSMQVTDARKVGHTDYAGRRDGCIHAAVVLAKNASVTGKCRKLSDSCQSRAICELTRRAYPRAITQPWNGRIIVAHSEQSKSMP